MFNYFIFQFLYYIYYNNSNYTQYKNLCVGYNYTNNGFFINLPKIFLTLHIIIFFIIMTIYTNKIHNNIINVYKTYALVL